MIIYPPVREAKYWRGQHVLKSLDDLIKRLSQRFDDPNTPPKLIAQYKEWGLKGHSGWDIPFNEGTEVIASHDGEVLFIEKDKSAGYGVILFDPKQRIRTIYWHLQSWIVEKGEKVVQGQVIGYGDSTGFSTGHHLHFGLKNTDEMGNTLNYNNGFRGGIDPMPHVVWFKPKPEPEKEVNMETKQIYKSRTFWVNLVALVALVIQRYTGLAFNMEAQLSVLAILNAILRLDTKLPIKR